MNLSLRCDKSYDRYVKRIEDTLGYLEWAYSKPIRKHNKWIHWFNGRSQPFPNYRVAGYIKRKRQIFKCFMKGWN